MVTVAARHLRLPVFQKNSETSRLFYLFYQDEIRYHPTPGKYIPLRTPIAELQLPYDYGNHMVDRRSPNPGNVGAPAFAATPRSLPAAVTLTPARTPA